MIKPIVLESLELHRCKHYKRQFSSATCRPTYMYKQAYFAHTMLYVFMNDERGRSNTLGRFITNACHGALTK